MTKRICKKYKLMKFYQEDLWGTLATYSDFKQVKINRILMEVSEEKSAFRNEFNVERKRLERKFKVDEIGVSEVVLRRRRSLFLQALKEFSKALRKMHFRSPFNFRVDVGKPKRKFRRLSKFAIFLKDRHKLVKFSTKSMNVRQFRNYLKKARSGKYIIMNFLRLFETRIDVLAFRLGFALKAGEVRQLINHGNFTVNGCVVFSSMQSLNFFDIFSVKDKQVYYDRLVSFMSDKLVIFNTPVYLEVNFRIMSAVLYVWPNPMNVFYIRKMFDSVNRLVGVGPKISKY